MSGTASIVVAASDARGTQLSRYLTSAVEQALWSLINLGVNLLLIRIAAPDQYGTFAFWANVAFVLASIQNALTLTHMLVLPPGSGLSPDRLPVERIMHAVTIAFLIFTALGVLAVALGLRATGHELGAPAAALFVPAFLLQQYFRTLAYARGIARSALFQTLGVLVASVALVGGGALLLDHISADAMLLLLGSAYGGVGLLGGAMATRGQDLAVNGNLLAGFRNYLRQSGWLFLGVSTTELLTRFYAFAVAGAFGATALASLSATQIFMRPVPLLATSWSMVARGDLVRRKNTGDWSGFAWMLFVARGVGLAIAALWSGSIYEAWRLISDLMFKGKYAQDAWMVLLWGFSAALSLAQVVISTPLQVLQAFKPLAIANTIASIVGAGAILVAMRLYGFGGAIAGTAIGQIVEVTIMAVMLWHAMARARSAAS